MAQVPTGSTFHIATAHGAQKVVSAITNDAEAVASSVGHGYVDGDIVQIQSGWGRINNRVFRVKDAAADEFTLEGLDTTNTTFFAAGAGAGTVKKLSAFTQITTVMNPASSGGDPKKVTYKFIESDIEYNINDGFSATDYTMELDADSINTPGYAALKTLTDTQESTVLKMQMRSGSILLVPCTVALNEAVSLQDGSINKVKASFSGNNRGTRYAA